MQLHNLRSQALGPTGIAWQKKTHHKYFVNLETYRTWYKLVVRATRCHTVPLSDVFQRRLVQWLRTNEEPRAASVKSLLYVATCANTDLPHQASSTRASTSREQRQLRSKDTAVVAGVGRRRT